ncbi:SIR2 family NAD-dependent protein deacylase [Lichenibacterium ramalinae]|nr:SIR2 family protein [Lichenibacterium ramalinae]
MSRNAVRLDPTSPRPPLWSGLLRPMLAELGAQGEAGLAPLDLAERYEETFGRGRLEGLIRGVVTDDAWEPGRLHERLLGLPWTDVLTTNYDTLLERAAGRITGIRYEPVLTPEDVARTRSPRVVKLHGSLPSHTPFVITASDYAAYPTRFAPFVNLARQILLENDVLMVGFSGDDPNFVNWTGWVRAEMDRHARTLFLAGTLDLDDAGRNRLRERSIVPVDLGPLVPDRDGDQDGRNARALELLVDALQRARPPSPGDWPSRFDWPPPMAPADGPARPPDAFLDLDDADFAGTYVERCAPRWRTERETYPGWVEPPPRVADGIRTGLADHLRSLRLGLGRIPLPARRRVLADVIWRVDLAHASLDDGELAWLAGMIAAPGDASDRDDRLLFGRVLLREHREREDREGFDRWRAWLAAGADGDRETTAALAYEESLWWRDRLSYERLRTLIPEVRGDDPLWHLRRSALWGELGEGREMVAAVREAWLSVAATVPRARRSVWLRSRLAWAAWVANAVTRSVGPDERVEEFVVAGLDGADPSRGLDPSCEPWDVVTGLDDAVAAAEGRLQRDRASVTSGFDAGVTRGPGLILRVAHRATVERLVVRTVDHVGIPPASGSVGMTAGRIARAVLASNGSGHLEAMRSLLAASRGSRALDDIGFDRVGIARMDDATVAELAARVEAAVVALARRVPQADAWERPAAAAATPLATLVELLSRVVVRLPGPRVASIVERALALSRQDASRVRDAAAPLGNLIRRALDALPAEERTSFLADVVAFPLPSERGVEAFPLKWPAPLLEVDFAAGAQGPDLSRAVERMLAVASSNDPVDAPSAVRRLSRLNAWSLLTSEERATFHALVWERRGSGGLAAWGMAGVEALCEVASPDTAEGVAFVRTQVNERLVDEAGPSPVALRLLSRLGAPDGGRVARVLSTEEVMAAVDRLLAWRGPARDRDVPDLFGLSERLARDRFEGATTVLVRTLLPALEPGDLDEALVRRWRELVAEPPSESHLTILPHLVRLGVVPAEAAGETIQRAALDGERSRSNKALLAIEAWLDLGEASAVPSELVDEVVSLVALRVGNAMPAALRIAARMVDEGRVTPGRARRLDVGLACLAREATYEAGPADETGRSMLGLVRAGAVTLAGSLLRRAPDDVTAANWLEAGRVDPLPEVRQAAAAFDAHAPGR